MTDEKPSDVIILGAGRSEVLGFGARIRAGRAGSASAIAINGWLLQRDLDTAASDHS